MKRILLVLFAIAALAQPSRTVKDPAATEDFRVDWSRVAANNAIVTSFWTAASGINIVTQANTGTVTLVRLSGGTVGRTYRLRNVVTLADAQVLAKTIDVYVDFQ